MNTHMIFKRTKPSMDTFDAVYKHFQPLVDKINEEGLELLQEAKKALAYYEGMPAHLTHEQALSALGELLKPKGIIAALESSFTDVFKCFTADVPSVVHENMDPAVAKYKYEDGISRAQEVIQLQRSRLDTLPERLSS